MIAAQRFISVAYPRSSLGSMSPVIKRGIGDQGCGYAVVFPHGGRAAIEDLVITIDRFGRVQNIPQCCDLGDCPDACPKQSDLQQEPVSWWIGQ
jgi:hypothetical protein